MEDAPDHAINDSEVGRDRSHVPIEEQELEDGPGVQRVVSYVRMEDIK